MIEIKLNLFGGAGDNAKWADTQDGTDDNLVTFQYNGNTYQIPEHVYNKVGSQLFGDEADRINNANTFIKYYITNGTLPTDSATLEKFATDNSLPFNNKIGWGGNGFNELKENLGTSLEATIAAGNVIVNGNYTDNIQNTSGGISNTTPTDPQKDAFSAYYKDLYSLEDGTGGKQMLDQLGSIYQQEADSAMTLADVNYQNQAMQQAQTIKAITDQVRAERMGRLRAGMSEAQIANQDMQMMMANVNALNQNANEMNQIRLEAQLGSQNAQGDAYKAYLEQANARGQIASATYAADTGNPAYMTIQNLNKKYPGGWTSAQYDAEYKNVTNTNTNP